MKLRSILRVLAGMYTLAGIGALIIGFVLPWDDPLAAAYPLLLGAPWTFLLSELDGYADSMFTNIILVTGAIALNAVLLWWWALTRRPAAREPE